VACAAALEILRSLDNLDLMYPSEHIGELFEMTTHLWPRRFPLIGDIRGLGAIRAIELVRDRITRGPAPEETRAVLNACHRRGLIIISAGTFGNVIRMLVPLVATDAQITQGLTVLEEALVEVHG
jgi:4-aminobutyrate aminotransferase/(S)-3-amino-2-methylpropionate transaminase